MLTAQSFLPLSFHAHAHASTLLRQHRRCFVCVSGPSGNPQTHTSTKALQSSHIAGHGFPVIFNSGAPPAWTAANPDWLRIMLCCSARPPCVYCTSFGFEVIYIYVWKDPSKLMWGQAAFYSCWWWNSPPTCFNFHPITWPVRWLKTGLSLRCGLLFCKRSWAFFSPKSEKLGLSHPSPLPQIRS